MNYWKILNKHKTKQNIAMKEDDSVGMATVFIIGNYKNVNEVSAYLKITWRLVFPSQNSWPAAKWKHLSGFSFDKNLNN